MTYTQNVNMENKTLKSNLVVDKGGFNLWIPEKLFRDTASKKNRLMFNIIGADIEINKEVTQIKFTGTFPDEIKFKRAQTQEIKTISLTYTKNKITLSVPYLDKKISNKTEFFLKKIIS